MCYTSNIHKKCAIDQTLLPHTLLTIGEGLRVDYKIQICRIDRFEFFYFVSFSLIFISSLVTSSTINARCLPVTIISTLWSVS